MTDTELLNELEKRAEAYHDKVKKDFAIEELEKVINKLDDLAIDEWNKQVGADKGLELAIDVIEDRISELKGESDKEYESEVITRGNCMICGKELTEGLFLCKECENKANSGK